MTASQPAAGSRRFFRAAPLWCAGLVLLLSGLTITGWVTGFQLLASVREKYIPMAPSTALCFALFAAALLFQVRTRLRNGWFVRGLGIVVFSVALAKLLELMFSFGFGIDAWLVRDPATFGAVLTGRMAPLTAVNFLVLTIGFLLITTRWYRWAGLLGSLVTVSSLIILIGYAYGTPVLYGGRFVPVALPTAFAFFVSGVAVISAAGPGAWPQRSFLGDSTRSLLLRAFVPAVTVLTILDGLLRARLLSHFTSSPVVTSTISTLIISVIVIGVVSIVSRKVGARIDAAETERNIAQADLMALNSHLEQRVRERTRELSEKHEQMGEELRMARELQFALLPHEYPFVSTNADARESALDFLSFFFPSGDVSGDFFTVFPLGQKAAGLIICDVMGHGVRAALVTGMVRVLVEEHAQTVSDPGELLTRINQGLTGILKQAGATMFATCFYLVADVEKKELRYANAGHPQPLRVRQRASGATVDWLPRSRTSGPAMGIFPDASYRTVTSPMCPGDVIALYTDGLFEVEKADGEILDQEDLLEIARRHASLPAEELLAQVVNDVRTLSQTATFEDDVCIVGLQVKAEAFESSD
ncbi:MAG TPA: PP2C family protein-serine/threonine phosphatase, partial [Prosthecobacter sp.]|nr:PP2C family protein-serine/threonine phosphatase [Prosthecobacter sp.]